jgi:hypothetical protein
MISISRISLIVILLNSSLGSVAQKTDTVQYVVSSTYKANNRTLLPLFDYRVSFQPERDGDNRITELTWTFQEVECLTQSVEGHIFRVLQETPIRVLCEPGKNQYRISNLEALAKMIDTAPIDLVMQYCDSYTLLRANEAFVEYALLDQIIPVAFLMEARGTTTTLSLPARCPDSEILYELTPIDMPDDQFLGQAEFDCTTQLSSLYAYFDCTRNWETKCYYYSKNQKIESAGNEYNKLPYASRRLFSKREFIYSREEYEQKQLDRILQSLEQRNNAGRALQHGRWMIMTATYSGSPIPVSISIDRQDLEAPFTRPPDIIGSLSWKAVRISD